MLKFFLGNINTAPNSLPGCILASPSKQHPDYYYHWARDAAISMGVIFDVRDYLSLDWQSYYKNYVKWVQHVHGDDDPNSGMLTLGEPKYFVDGSVYNQPWGRPQNDGPALRARALMRFATFLLDNGEEDYVKQVLYKTGNLDDPGVIKKDLEFVAHHWQDDSFDLWEEIRGDHFFTKMVQRQSLIAGARLAKRMDDTGASQFYAQQAQALENAINQHWNDNDQLMMETPPGHGGPQKYKELDIAIVLASLAGETNYPGTPEMDLYGPTDTKILKTVNWLNQVFNDGTFNVQNQDNARGLPGVLIGRYPNDTYSGYGSGQGNPWILATNAMGELYYRNSKKLFSLASDQRVGRNRNEILSYTTPERMHLYRQLLGANYPRNQTLTALARAFAQNGDGYLLRVRYHVEGANFHLSEQINRDNGQEQGANDLTWSYGTVLSAMQTRSTLPSNLLQDQTTLFKPPQPSTVSRRMRRLDV